MQETNGSLTDRVNELSNTLSTVCQERQELVDEYEKENKEAKEVIKMLIGTVRELNNPNVQLTDVNGYLAEAEQFLGE